MPHRSRRVPGLAAASLLATLTAANARAQAVSPLPGAFGSGCNDTVAALLALPGGSLVAGGRFSDAGGVACSRIARWQGSGWSQLGGGVDGPVHALLALPNGDLVAGGAFLTAGGLPVNGLARWDGAAWSAFGQGVDPIAPFGASVQALARLPNGDLVIGGSFAAVSGVPCANVARWNGASWAPLGLGCNGFVRALAVAPNGDLLATGGFLQAGGSACAGIARWDGAVWSPLGSGLGAFGGIALAVQANGGVVAGGSFVTAGGLPANRVARWDGTTWSALGSGVDAAVTSLLALPGGDLLAGGLFTQAGGLPAAGLARWNGVAWSPLLASGVDAPVHEMALAADFGSVVVGGEFTAVNGAPAGRLARLVSTMAPTAVAVGAGCAGSGGPDTLAATALPMVGATFRATGSGLPAFAFVLAVSGFTPVNLPLAAALPQALPGCSLYTTPDHIDLLLPVGGTASTTYALPGAASLVGVAFVHQYVALEVDPSFALLAVTSSNALQVTLGTF